MTVTLGAVFGVGNVHPLSYIERLKVDDEFRSALSGPNPIIVYGASKQGKTALVSRYLPYDENIVIRLTPKTGLRDIYQTALRQSGIEIEEENSTNKSTEGTVSVGSKWSAILPFLANGEVSGDLSSTRSETHAATSKKIQFNLELPQDIGELLNKLNKQKTIILENFHYLSDDNQKAFAFDLRTFQEIGVKFIILGVWKEKNRMLQFNGDLVDRIVEIPVEPWGDHFLFSVARKGEEHLNIKFGSNFLRDCVASSFGSIGVFQELIKGVCEHAKVTTKQTFKRDISDADYLAASINQRVMAYETRHKQALISIASGQKSHGGSTDAGLFLPYYLVRVLLERGYDGIKNGITRSTLHAAIKEIHHRPNDVRASDMSNLLYNLGELQAKKSIKPPIFDYDRHAKALQVVDSTFNFFVKHANLVSVLEDIEGPFDDGLIIIDAGSRK